MGSKTLFSSSEISLLLLSKLGGGSTSCPIFERYLSRSGTNPLKKGKIDAGREGNENEILLVGKRGPDGVAASLARSGNHV